MCVEQKGMPVLDTNFRSLRTTQLHRRHCLCSRMRSRCSEREHRAANTGNRTPTLNR